MRKTLSRKYKIEWALLCNHSVIDRDSNTISIHNVMEEITLRPTPKEVEKISSSGLAQKSGLALAFEFVSSLKRETDIGKKETVQAKLVVLDPSGKRLTSIPWGITFNPKIRRMRSRIKFNVLPFHGLGDYIFLQYLKPQVKGEFIEVARVELTVK